MELDKLPKSIRDELNIAKEIILTAGAKEIYIFGSIARGDYSDNSDIDLAIIGLEKSKFFHVYGELLEKLRHDIDVIGLDYNNEFSNELKKNGTLIRVA
ncbi:MAG: hypothetical protein GF317_03265 [Candidatus Lokiarchaeota archaeon]|nr:hypothetical protein [Candidatus Lokiarchaeota archaeon]